MSDSKQHKREDQAEAKREASTLMASGVAVAAIGALGAVIGSAVCPVCVVAAPALFGAGAFKRWRASRKPDPQTSR